MQQPLKSANTTRLPMRLLHLCQLIMSLFVQNLNAQVATPPAYSSSIQLNYARSWSAAAPIQNADTMRSRPLNDVKQATVYYDALGRAIQTVLKQATPSKKDLVIPSVYDSFGRQQYAYLPFVANARLAGDSVNDGGFKLDAFQQDSVFNQTQFPTQRYFYGQTDFENSALSRVQQSFAPGNSWMGSRGSGTPKSVRYQYLINSISDSVRIWTIGFAIGSIPTTSAFYAAGTLSKQILTDEAGHQTVVYANALGQTILKKAQLYATPGTGHAGWLCTYYVYDDLGNARFVLQPRCVELINGSWTISQSLANELCFRYEYDARHRLIIQKIPGAGETDAVYDARDRMVMAQDSNLRVSGKWLVVEYDAENRPWRGGLLTDANTRAYHQNLAQSSTTYPNTASNYEVLSQTFYDDYSWVSGTGTSLGTSLDATNTGNSSYFITGYNASPTYAQAITQNTQTRGAVTGSKVKVIGTTSQYLYQESFFDDHGRVIQAQSINYTGGKDEVTSQYSFSGQVLRTYLQHQKSGTNPQNHTVLSKLSYDSSGRPISLVKNVDNTSDQLIATYSYNELGQLKNKALGNNLENLAYAYNIRGWLATINKDYVSGASGTNYFGMELGYDTTTSVAPTTSYTASQYNGNITGTVWKSRGDGVGRKYDYSYDNSGRLTAAAFVQNTTGSTWDNATIDFSLSSMTYDANGNILSLNRKGFKLGGSTYIDQLTYGYLNTNASNKLNAIVDAANDTTAKLGDFQYNPATKQSTDYSYDGNGNQLKDNNRKIDAITYNFLNLTQQLHVNGKGNIQYVFDAGGGRLQKIIIDSPANKKTITTYVAGFVYQSYSTLTGSGTDTLQMLSHEEGRIRWAYHKYTTGTSAYKYEYDFFVRDNQGNTRMVLTQQKDTAKYLASMEAAYRSTETALFNNITNSSYARSMIAGYPADGTTTPNDSLSHLNGNGQKTGPSLLLKVMSGDTLDIGVHSFYTSMTGTGTSASITDVLNSLASGISNMTAGAKGTVSQLTNPSGTLYAALNNFITNSDPNPSGKPKAYLNWILFDEQLNPVSSYPQTGAIPVGNYTAGTLGTPGQTGIPMTKNGYLYIWVSNETQGWDVYFDNLSVTHHTGPLLEENHYYPFGLAMSAISARALKTNYTENKLRFNGGSEMQNREFSDGSGLEMYETSFRGYDAQTGRFAQIDPMAGGYLDYSTYGYCTNNPVLLSDPSGAIIRYQQQNNRLPQADEYSEFENLLGGGGGGGGQSDVQSMTGIGSNSFEDWVTNVNEQIDRQVDRSNLISTTEGLLAFMPNESLLQLTNNYDGTFNVTCHPDITRAEWGTDKGGNSGIRYEYSYAGTDDGGEFLHESLNTDYIVSGFIKYNTYGLFNPNASADEGGHGNGNNGFEIGERITEASGIAFQTTQQAMIGAQRLANQLSGTGYKILKGGEAAKFAGKSLAIAGAGLTVLDGMTNGWQSHHIADIGIDGIIYGISELSGPVGWVIGGGWFLANLIYENSHDGKSITEDLFDHN